MEKCESGGEAAVQCVCVCMSACNDSIANIRQKKCHVWKQQEESK